MQIILLLLKQTFKVTFSHCAELCSVHSSPGKAFVYPSKGPLFKPYLMHLKCISQNVAVKTLVLQTWQPNQIWQPY